MNPSEKVYTDIQQLIDDTVNGSLNPSWEDVRYEESAGPKSSLSDREKKKKKTEKKTICGLMDWEQEIEEKLDTVKEGAAALEEAEQRNKASREEHLELSGLWKYNYNGRRYELNFFALLGKEQKKGQIRLNQEKFKV